MRTTALWLSGWHVQVLALILPRLVCPHLADLQVSLLFEGSSLEDASGASSIAVGGTSADIGAESSAATNDTLDTDLASCPFPSTHEERSHDVSSIRIP